MVLTRNEPTLTTLTHSGCWPGTLPVGHFSSVYDIREDEKIPNAGPEDIHQNVHKSKEVANISHRGTRGLEIGCHEP